MKIVYSLLTACCLIITGCRRESNDSNPYYERMKHLADEMRANPNDKAALRTLEKHTTDWDYWNRYYAYSFLAQLAIQNIGDCQSEVIPFYDKMLKDSDQGIRRLGAETILDMPVAIDKMLPTLLTIIKQGKEDDVTWFSTQAVGKIESTQKAKEIIPTLLKAASTPPPEGTQEEAPQVRYYALDSIEELAKRNNLNVVPQLEDLLNESSPPYKRRVAKTILGLDSSNKAAQNVVNSSDAK